MKFAAELRRRARQAIGPMLGLTLAAYFAYHTVQGERGLLAWWHFNRDIHAAEAKLAGLEETRDALESRTRLLRPDRLDPDMLEERARAMDDLGHDDELVILRPNGLR